MLRTFVPTQTLTLDAANPDLCALYCSSINTHGGCKLFAMDGNR